MPLKYVLYFARQFMNICCGVYMGFTYSFAAGLTTYAVLSVLTDIARDVDK